MSNIRISDNVKLNPGPFKLQSNDSSGKNSYVIGARVTAL